MYNGWCCGHRPFFVKGTSRGHDGMRGTSGFLKKKWGWGCNISQGQDPVSSGASPWARL